MIVHLTVAESGIRLDKYVSEHCPELSRTRARKLIDEGKVTVNGRTARASLRLEEGDEVDISLPPPISTTLAPEEAPLDIVYEDDELFVVDKPAGIPVHPAPGHPAHTLVNALLAHYPSLININGSQRPGIVHRLDKDTSGLMVVAKSRAAQLTLQSQFKEHSVVKRYTVLVRGHLAPQRGAIEAAIGRDPRNRKRMAVVYGGKEARTLYRVLNYFDEYTLLEVTPETGRTHQIRVHLSAIGHPVIGDATYGVKSPLLKRQFIHANLLGFRLPSTNKHVEFKSELPPDLRQTLELISPHP
jgi:23S rRNA pseudouridine1911/1915/1917 synthase